MWRETVVVLLWELPVEAPQLAWFVLGLYNHYPHLFHTPA